MKSSLIVSQEIARILKDDPIAAAKVGDHFKSQSELLELLALPDLQDELETAQERITELEHKIDQLKDSMAHCPSCAQ
jgi:chaperonin cofactor prefoldin